MAGASDRARPDSDRVQRHYQAVRDLSGPERHAYFESALSDDPAVRTEVRSLLEHADAGEAFFDRLAKHLAAASTLSPDEPESANASPADDLPPGSTVGRYRVIGRIGAGGMGTLYRAHDPALGREIALKLLPAHRSGDDDARERFLIEARAAAALDHPNICTIHEVGEAADGAPFLALALYRGETLKQRLARGRLPLEEAVACAIAIARGLAAAHAAGIVHRDVKPGNIMLCDGGDVKLLDFGLARLGDATLTRPGMMPGTVAYMSPEQVQGGPVDHRSDLWSLGVVMYEMLCGVRPFRGEGDRVLLNAIAHDAPPPVRSLRPALPKPVARVVERLLQKDPAKRFGSAADVVATLDGTAPSPSPRQRLAAAAAAALLVLAAVGWLLRGGAGPVAEAEAGAGSERVLVADFANFTPDSLLGDAVSSALRVEVARAADLHVAGAPAIAAALGRMRRDPGARLDGELAREVAFREGIRAVVDGEVRRVGSGWVLSARLVEAATGEVIDGWRETAADSTGVARAVERLAATIREDIGHSLGTLRPGDGVYPRTTRSLDALRVYSEANRTFFRGDYGRSLTLYDEAVRLDSSFSAAHTMVAYNLQVLGGSLGRLRRAHDAAYRFRDGLVAAERHAADGNYHWWVEGDLPRAIDAFRRHVEAAKAAGDVVQYTRLGRALMLAGDLDGAEAVLRESREVYSTAGNQRNLVEVLYRRGNLEGASAALDDARARFPDHPALDLTQARMAAASGDFEGALRLAGRLPSDARAGGGPQLVALVAATRGQLREALARFADLREEMLASDNPGAAAEAAIAMARIQLVRGDTAEAVAEVERHLAAHPLQDLDPLDRPYLSLARLFADSRDLHRARHFLEAWERESPPRFRGADRWNFHRARAALHVAEGRPDSALAHLALASRALPVAASFDDASIGIHERPETARAWLLAGQPDSAIAILRRYVGLTSIDRIEIDAFELAGALVRLSELLDASGHGAAARRFFARFAELWQAADPELQSRVETARRGMDTVPHGLIRTPQRLLPIE